MRAPVRIALLGNLAALALSACALRPTPQDAFYRLELVPPARVLEQPVLAGVLEVGALRADPLTGGRAMLYRSSTTSTQVHRLPYSYWSDSPTAMLQAELAAYARAAGVALEVVTPAARTHPDFAVSGTILRLERIRGDAPRVLIEIELSVVERQTRKLLLFEVYREEQLAVGTGVEDTVAAFGLGLTRIFDAFVADLAAIRSAGIPPTVN
jgi:ABC-type uncharacterized transport system auxiliary subunit